MSSLSPLASAPTPPRATHSRLRSTTISSLTGGGGGPSSSHPPAPASTSSAPDHSPTVRLTCWAHKDGDKLPLVVLNPKSFPYAKDGDIIRIRQLNAPGASGGSSVDRKSKKLMGGGMLFKYGEADIAKIDNPRLKLSIRESAVAAFGFKADTATLQLDVVDREEVTADFIELFFKDQYIGRSDMWRLGCSLEDSCIYMGQEITFAGVVKAEVRNIYVGGERVSSSYFTARTKTIFRSASAKYFVFIQVCRETYEFDEDGERYYEKAMDGFLPELFERWHALKANHVVTIVLFGRVSYDPAEIDLISPECLKHNEEVGWYKDFYKVCFDMETILDARVVINRLKIELANFRKIVLLDHHHKPGTKAVIPGFLTYAYQGNVLEAINLALNPYDRHHLDRDFVRTGLCLTLITPGTGYFKVDKHLLRLTTERCNDHGLGLDLVCLNKMPLHSVPLFGYLSANPDLEAETPGSSGVIAKDGSGRQPPLSTSAGNKEAGSSLKDPLYYDPPTYAGTSELRIFYSVVFWVYCSFWSKSSDKKYRKGMFFPRVKMSNIQSLGVLNHDLSTIVLPLLRQQDGVGGQTREERKALREAHDARVFAHVEPLDHLDDAATSMYSASTKLTTAGGSVSSRGTLGLSQNTQTFLSSSYRSVHSAGGSSFPKPGSLRDRLLLESANAPRPAPGAGFSTSFGRTSPVKPKTRKLPPTDETEELAVFHKREVPRSNQSSFSGGVRPPHFSSNLSQRLQPAPVPVRNASVTSIVTSGTVTPRSHDSVGASASPAQLSIDALASAIRPPPVKEPFFAKLGSKLLYPFYAPRAAPTPPASSAASVNNSTPPATPLSPNSSATPGPFSPAPPSVLTLSRASPEQAQPISMPTAGQSSSRRSIKADSPQNSFSDVVLHGSGAQDSSPGLDMRLRFGAGAAPRWQRVVNPCNPSASQMMARDGSQRWQHILPRAVNLHRVKWKSLTTPACLPITTHYLPPQTELSSRNLYTLKSIEYPMAEFDESAFIRPSANGNVDKRAVVKEMAMQRLAQGFQVIVAEEDTPAPEPAELTIITNLATQPLPVTKAAHVPKRPLPGGASEALRSSEGSIFMSLSNQIHRLDYKEESDTVTVRQYTRVSKYSTAEIPYEGLIWSSMASSFRKTEAMFNFPSTRWETFRWNKLDDLVTGSSTDMDSIGSAWRARFILVPSEQDPASIITNNETLSNEEVHIEGARILVDQFTRARYNPPSESENLAALEPIRLILSTLDPSQSVQDEAVGKQLRDLQNRRRVGKNHMTIGKMSLAEINMALMDPKSGLGLGEHMWGLRRYPNSFTSDALVDWLYKSCRDIKTVDQAAACAKKLYDDGLFKHMTGQHKFIHGTYIYQFCPPYGPAVAKSSGGWFSSRRGTEKAKAVAAERPLDSPTSETAPRTSKRRRVARSNEVIIDLDPHRVSDRAETATLRHDLLYNEKNGFNFEFMWLGITAGLAENLRKQWSEKVWRYGLRIVEAPVYQISTISSRSAFRAPLHIPLALQPPDSTDFDPNLSGDQRPVSYFYENAFLYQQGFVLDFESDKNFPPEVDYQYPGKPYYDYSQFVHRSGLAFVQNLGEGKGFLWLNNSLYSDTKRDLKNAQGLSIKARERALREKFVATCSSGDALRESYKTARLARERDFELMELTASGAAGMTKTTSTLSSTSSHATGASGDGADGGGGPVGTLDLPPPPTPGPVSGTLLSPPHSQPLHDPPAPHP